MGFFDEHSQFLDSSIVGNWGDRLNARYEAIVEANKSVFDGARVLDLASHDGRWSYAALDAGAAHVLGIEVRPELAASAARNMTALGVSPDRYRFEIGDLFERKEVFREPFDVVLCLGFLYHTTRHVELLQLIRSTNAPTVIIDTAVVPLKGNFNYIGAEISDRPSNGRDAFSVRGDRMLFAVPTVGALQLMLQHYGYTVRQIDWAALISRLGLTADEDGRATPSNPVGDYYMQRRGTFVATLQA